VGEQKKISVNALEKEKHELIINTLQMGEIGNQCMGEINSPFTEIGVMKRDSISGSKGLKSKMSD